MINRRQRHATLSLTPLLQEAARQTTSPAMSDNVVKALSLLPEGYGYVFAGLFGTLIANTVRKQQLL